jgi:hypothetical protein
VTVMVPANVFGDLLDGDAVAVFVCAMMLLSPEALLRSLMMLETRISVLSSLGFITRVGSKVNCPIW